MSLKKIKTTTSSPIWTINLRPRVGDVVEHNSGEWINTTGANSEPGVGTDWVAGTAAPVTDFVSKSMGGTFDGEIEIDNNLQVNLELDVVGNSVFSGEVFVDQQAEFYDNVTVDGDTSMGQNVYMLGLGAPPTTDPTDLKEIYIDDTTGQLREPINIPQVNIPAEPGFTGSGAAKVVNGVLHLQINYGAVGGVFNNTNPIAIIPPQFRFFEIKNGVPFASLSGSTSGYLLINPNDGSIRWFGTGSHTGTIVNKLEMQFL